LVLLFYDAICQHEFLIRAELLVLTSPPGGRVWGRRKLRNVT
jgi:hypothetical protein